MVCSARAGKCDIKQRLLCKPSWWLSKPCRSRSDLLQGQSMIKLIFACASSITCHPISTENLMEHLSPRSVDGDLCRLMVKWFGEWSSRDSRRYVQVYFVFETVYGPDRLLGVFLTTIRSDSLIGEMISELVNSWKFSSKYVVLWKLRSSQLKTELR